MKSPKLFGQPGATMAKGKAKARALQGTGAPFLTARGPGYTTRMKNGFLKVEVDEAEQAQEQPIFWMLDSGATAKAQTATTKRRVKRLPITTGVTAGGNFVVASLSALNVGANRMVYFVEDHAVDDEFSAGAGGAYYIGNTWPAVGSVRSGGGYQDHGISRMIGRSLFATGWDDARKTWRWGYTTKAIGVSTFSLAPGASYDGLPMVECIPRAHLSGLDTRTATEVMLPNDGNRVYFGGVAHVVGPGKLASLICVLDLTTTASPIATTLRVPPYLATSDDHGESWARSPLPLTIPGIYRGSRYREDRLKLTAQLSFFVYLGSGKSLFILHYATGVAAFGTEKSHSDCFIYEGGAFTPVAWGYEDSPFLTVPVTRVDTFSSAGFAAPADHLIMEPINFCFGPGCAALLVVNTTDSLAPVFGLRITRDFGATWSQVLITSLLGAGVASAFMRTAQPYLSEESPGLIYLTSFSSEGMLVFKTDGRFLNATLLGTVPGASFNGATLINKGASPYPQLPDEFGPPT